MRYRLSGLPGVEIEPGFASERDWLAHLSLLAGLPYPSLALMPSILATVRSRVRCAVGGFGWTDGDIHPTAFMTEHMSLRAYQWWIDNASEFFALCPIQAQWDSRGESFRQFIAAPAFAETAFFHEVFGSQGLRWATLAPVRIAQGEGYGFLSVYRAPEAGPFTDVEQARLWRGAQALAGLDRRHHAWQAPAPVETALAGEASLLIRSDGALAARSQEAARLLYLQGGANMHTLDWARLDWRALPVQVQDAARGMFAQPAPELKRRVCLHQPWGRFEFALEKMSGQGAAAEALVIVGIRFFEAIDITVARRLAGWPLSPREKRLVVAGTRSASLAELARTLEITLLTLKTYNRELVNRLQVDSRQRLIGWLLSEEAGRHDPLFRPP
ncbi:helix-turn-helix transcriptional regulator [Ottowia sp.]|uniref:helix-turn-helix transcriptional regulator n=1 Tax=Ottowia sp. TaxID=1898956 RepID=UPI0039E55414